MTEEIRAKMSEELLDKLEKLNELELGSEEYKTAAESIAKLYDVGMKELVADYQYTEQVQKNEEDLKLRREELEEKRKGRLWGTIADGVKTLLPIGVYIWAYVLGLEFETEHTWTNSWTRRLVDSVPFFKKK